MSTDVPGESFELEREVDHLGDFRIAFVGHPQVVAGIEGLLQADAQLIGDHAGDLIHAPQWNPQHTANVFDCRAGLECSKGADLSNTVFAVFFFHIANDVGAAFFAKVDIDIGGFRTIFIQKSFEQQIVFERTNVAQVQRVAYQRPHARTTSGRRNVKLSGLLNKVPTDQKVVRESQLVDHAQFAIQTIYHRL